MKYLYDNGLGLRTRAQAQPRLPQQQAQRAQLLLQPLTMNPCPLSLNIHAPRMSTGLLAYILF